MGLFKSRDPCLTPLPTLAVPHLQCLRQYANEDFSTAHTEVLLGCLMSGKVTNTPGLKLYLPILNLGVSLLFLLA